MFPSIHLLTISVCIVLLMGCAEDREAMPLPEPPPYFNDAGKSHFRMRVKTIAKQTAREGGVLFLGDSLTEGADWQGFFPEMEIKNLGIGWDTTHGLQSRWSQTIRYKPDKIFIQIGTNDLSYAQTPDQIVETVGQTIRDMTYAQPQAHIFLQSLLPREADLVPGIKRVNAGYYALSLEFAKVTYIDLFDAFADADGTLYAHMTYDGLHLNKAGYQTWAHEIEDLIRNEWEGVHVETR